MKKLLACGEKKILEKLNNAGYEAYFVGGCVRDALMGTASDDIDITTSAMPQQTKEVFCDWHTIDTGIKHGTVTVMRYDDESAAENPNAADMAAKGTVCAMAEVTTFRSDGTYSDSRHPDSVRFVRTLEEDLARRDFTVNAMACDIKGGVYDPFGGRRDLEDGIIRAVGESDLRFREDALRIMRALRFAAVLGFEIEEETEAAIFRNCGLLKEIAVERIFVEFKKLVKGKAAGNVLRKYVDVIGSVIPELAAMKGFEQHNSYHKYDVLEHCIRALEAVRTVPENEEHMKLAALFHDIGKPETFTMDDKGVGHFYGHPAKSEEIVKRILKRLKADRFTYERVSLLVKRHDLLFDRDERLLKRWMNKLSAEVMFELLEIKRADNFGTGNMSSELADKFEDIRLMMERIVEAGECFSIKNLAVSGRDLIDGGMKQGAEIGQTLEMLLEAVINEEVVNEKEELMAFVFRK